jgi:phosphatidate cytidylyltransferase
MGFALPEDSRLLLLAVLPFVIGFGAVWGDLVESGIKREFGAKDAGGWLPGFGGLLDRIDSLILVVPLATYALRAIA